MQTESLIFMITAEVIIVSLTLYFFIKALLVKPKDEPDSYTEE